MRWGSTFAVLVGFAFWSTLGRAQPRDTGHEHQRSNDLDRRLVPHVPTHPPRFSDRPLHLEARAGFGTLVGLLGATAGYNVHDRIELGAGGGVNIWGPMGGAYVRLRPVGGPRPNGRLHAFSIDLGVSAGPWRDAFAGWFPAMGHGDPDDYERYHSDLAVWLQGELSWETWSVSGFTLRLGAGYATMLNRSDIVCYNAARPDESCGASGAVTTVGVFTVALGYAASLTRVAN